MARTNSAILKPLTVKENQDLSIFIGECVRNNRVFHLTTQRIGVDDKFTIQDLYNSNIQTLQTVGSNLQRQLSSKQGLSPVFGGPAETFKKGGVEVTTLIAMLELMIRNRAVEEDRARKQKELDEINAKLDAAKTPSQIKAELKKEKLKLEKELA